MEGELDRLKKRSAKDRKEQDALAELVALHSDVFVDVQRKLASGEQKTKTLEVQFANMYEELGDKMSSLDAKLTKVCGSEVNELYGCLPSLSPEVTTDMCVVLWGGSAQLECVYTYMRVCWCAIWVRVSQDCGLSADCMHASLFRSCLLLPVMSLQEGQELKQSLEAKLAADAAAVNASLAEKAIELDGKLARHQNVMEEIIAQVRLIDDIGSFDALRVRPLDGVHTPGSGCRQRGKGVGGDMCYMKAHVLMMQSCHPA